VGQVFQVRLFSGAITAWHCHAEGTDRLFASSGYLRLVLFDARDGSPSHRRVNEIHLGEARPALVAVPPGVWHGLQNLGGTDAVIVNIPDVAYDYQSPDHYRLPFDAPEIGFDWSVRRKA
jgi:dTDP-4-dehydrorhamnose 3,5-epimerase